MNNYHKLLRSLLVTLGLATPALFSCAEDIDLYAGFSASSVPNVLLVLDNSANWGSSLSVSNCYFKDNGVVTTNGPKSSSPDKEQGAKMAIEKCALYNLIDALPVKPIGGSVTANNNALFNVGLMLFNNSGGNSGGYPRKAFTALTSNNKAAFKNIISGLTIGGDKGSGAAFAKAMHEAYLYYRGSAPYSGTMESKWDSAAVSGGNYVSPATSTCGPNHVIFIANGGPGEVTDSEARALLSAAGGDATQINYPTSVVKGSDQANWADEFARFMRGVDVSSKDDVQGIITHGVAVTGASSDGLYPNFIRSMANHGGGSYFSASDADTLEAKLTEIFNQMQGVDSVFTSASIPVSTNARGTFMNQVFMGTFRPDVGANPRWRGNLKQYRLGIDSLGTVELIDTAGTPAISGTTGIVRPDAISYWTTDSSFWSNEPIGTPSSPSDSPDGDKVEKGGAAQRLRTVYATSQASRKVYTCIACAGNTALGSSSATEFKDTNAAITQAMLGVGNATDRGNLIAWVRGTDNAGDELGPTTSPATTIRPSVHGDVLHSRPAVVSYGGSIGVVVFYGANDGMLRAVKGNPTGSGAGDELWSFVPQEMYSKLGRLRSNAPIIRLSTTVSASATPRDYFVDGPISVYQKINADGSINKVTAYVGMRRGGRLLYAFDVTDPTAPRYLWKKTSSDLARLGQTWSEPKVARIKGNANPVLIFGGGYDAVAEDANSPGATTMGDRVYVLDAFDGTLLWEFSTTRSVAADVTLLDSDIDGYIDRAYAVDLGGKLYRIDLETSSGDHAPADWSIYTVADLSGGTSTGRKFFFAPDAVHTKLFTALMLGSGDREKPLLSATEDHFFQIFDTNLGKGAVNTAATVWGDLTAAGANSSTAGKGCYVALAQGEKVVNAPTSLAGTTYFGTNRPGDINSGNTCSANLGIAKSYAMPLFCVTPTSSMISGGGLPPSPVAGIVIVNTPSGPKSVPFVIGAPNAKNSAIEASRIYPSLSAPRRRTYWYQESNR